MDRNIAARPILLIVDWSLSARRAWIEMDVSERESLAEEVALRKESVDRNTSFLPVSLFDLPSLSARRAWIEMFF